MPEGNGRSDAMFKKLTTKEMLRNEQLRSLQSDIRLEQENQQQGIELSEREIQEIIQGQQMSDLDIQLLELQGGM